MKTIIFVRVADMKYYQGITEKDEPINGGASDQEKEYVERMIHSVDSFQGENWLGKGGEA